MVAPRPCDARCNVLFKLLPRLICAHNRFFVLVGLFAIPLSAKKIKSDDSLPEHNEGSPVGRELLAAGLIPWWSLRLVFSVLGALPLITSG